MRYSKAVGILRRCLREGVAWLENQGYTWFRTTYMQAISSLESSPTGHRKGALSRAYYQVGDLHFLHGAHNAAIKAYRRALILDPHLSAAMREIGEMYYLTGDIANAKRYHRMCLATDPSDRVARDALSFLEKTSTRRIRALSRRHDRYDEVSEALVDGRADAVLKLLDPRRFRSVRARRYRAMAYGILGELDSVLGEWSSISRMRGDISLSLSDFFFLPDRAWHTVRFWRILWLCADRITNFCLTPLGLMHDLPDPPRSRAVSRLSRKRRTRRYRLVIRYHIWRCEGAVEKLRLLQTQFPSWKGLAEIVAYHDGRGRMRRALTPEQKGFLHGGAKEDGFH